MNHVFMFVLLSTMFTLGLVVGDAWTPLSGTSNHALSERCTKLEARVAEFEARCARLEASVGEASTRLELWLRQKPAPWLIPVDDGGTHVVTW